MTTPSTTKPGADKQVRYGRILGLIFATAGFVAIGVGWNGMAKQACPDCQLPYLLSGGATGLGLIVFGAALLVVSGLRAERLAADRRMQDLIKATGQVGSALAITTGEAVNGLVVAGRSTYHRPDCRLVKDKDLAKITVQTAAGQGLSACRVCSPAEPEAVAEASSGDSGSKKGSSKKSSRKKASSKK